MADSALQLLHERIALMLDEASQFFKPGRKTTFIARNPENDEEDVLVTDDDIPALEALLVRMKDRVKRQ